MIADKFFKRFRQPTQESKVGLFLVLMGIVVIVAIIVKTFSAFQETTPTPLLAPAPGLFQFSTLEEANERMTAPLYLPQDTEAEIAVMGLYTQATPILPAHSVVSVYKKDNWRFVEIIQKPEHTWENEKERYSPHQIEDVKITPQTPGKFVRLRPRNFRCEDPTETRIGICQITNVLYFPHKNQLISIAADGNHATDGELIYLAQSILNRVDEDITP